MLYHRELNAFSVLQEIIPDVAQNCKIAACLCATMLIRSSLLESNEVLQPTPNIKRAAPRSEEERIERLEEERQKAIKRSQAHYQEVKKDPIQLKAVQERDKRTKKRRFQQQKEIHGAEAILKKRNEVRRNSRHKRKAQLNPHSDIECTGCGKLSPTKETARQHRRVCSMKRCGSCRRSVRKEAFESHLQQCDIRFVYTVDGCNKVYRTPGGL